MNLEKFVAKGLAAQRAVDALIGSQLALRNESGGYRHYLEGRDVHCGDQLRMKLPGPGGEWIWARYEASISRWGISATLHTTFGIFVPNGDTMLRWPTEDER